LRKVLLLTSFATLASHSSNLLPNGAISAGGSNEHCAGVNSTEKEQ